VNLPPAAAAGHDGGARHESNPPEVAADPDGAAAGVRRHQAVLRRRGASPPAAAPVPLTPEEKALGIEGDTPRDTVATLVAQVKQLRTELQTALNDNKNQKSRERAPARAESAIDQRIQSALDGERGRLQQDREQVASDRQQTQGLLQDLQRRLDGFPARAAQADLPVGPGAGRKATARRRGARSTGGTRWVEPDDAKPTQERQQRRLNFPTSFGPAQKHARNRVEPSRRGSRAPWARPSRSIRCRRTRR
jgi:integrating conjugative element protein (TIGR03752 family)